jgi:hypothetical protein
LRRRLVSSGQRYGERIGRDPSAFEPGHRFEHRRRLDQQGVLRLGEALAGENLAAQEHLQLRRERIEDEIEIAVHSVRLVRGKECVARLPHLAGQ